jgi:2-keto-4-pentenoate hydratase/2-oxohepta-3-ene-1,7-dioic acid hydratase in catechol pathway
MRLVTYTFRGTTRLGAMNGDNEVIDLARAGTLRGASAVPDDMISLLRGGDGAMENARRALALARELASRNRAQALERGILFDTREAGFQFEAPIPRPGKVLAIGLNYRDHAAETKAEIPSKPVVFTKVSTCVTGHGKPIYRPRVSAAVDWEGEFCFVIGKRARYVKAADASRYIAGYTIGHDVSVRDWQFHSSTWMMGKGFDTHGPLGPYLVTPDEAGDVGNLEIQTWVNGVLKQHSNTSQLIFGVGALVEYISSAFTLEPGDVIFTGTPAGVGATRRPPEWLKAGDTVRIAITNLGVLENPVVDEPESFD